MTAPNPAPRAEHSPLPGKAQRWWESAGMTLDDASDAEERAEWERCKITRIKGANGETVSAAHDLAYTEPADSDLIVYANVNQVAIDGGWKSITTGLASYRCLSHHHHPESLQNTRSLIGHHGHRALHQIN